ncbi:MAG: hypothetical protein L0241_13190 [Planctomycetia bacterium]|nr:hypothetical protein [Planctomycetia bacterium]
MHGLARPRAALGCEHLEPRDCPAIFTLGGLLVVVGTGGADTVNITDDGAGNITASLNGDEETATGIQAVTVLTFGGNDTVNYTLDGDQTGRRAVLVDAGSGDDTVTLTAGNINGQFAFLANGSAGADTLSEVNCDVAAGAVLAIALGGGIGNDTITGTAAGEIDGYFALSLSGGAGNDTITGEVDVAGDSTGQVVAVVSGGFGDDNLTLNVTGDGLTELQTLIAVLSGGLGTDTATATDNVTQIGVP